MVCTRRVVAPATRAALCAPLTSSSGEVRSCLVHVASELAVVMLRMLRLKPDVIHEADTTEDGADHLVILRRSSRARSRQAPPCRLEARDACGGSGWSSRRIHRGIGLALGEG